MESKIREIRVNLDTLAKLEIGKARELSIAKTSIENSKMWLGKVLKEMDIPNPYPESRNHESKVIEPTADISKSLPTDFEQLEEVGKTKYLRLALKEVEEKIYDIKDHDLPNKLAHEFKFQSYIECIKAGMWLGMYLGVLRDSQAKQEIKVPLTPDKAFKQEENGNTKL